MKVYLSENGLGLASVLIIILLFYFFTGDAILAYASFLLASIFLLVLLFAYNTWKKKSVCKTKVKERVWVWEHATLSITVEGKNIYAVEGIPKWIKNTKLEFTKDAAVVRGETYFPHYGEFVLEQLTVLRRSPLGLFTFKEKVAVEVMYNVLPETFYWLLEALNILRATGVSYLGAGTRPSSLTGDLYYETREYVYGDPIRNIDWKATARHRKLMVKLFEEETSKSFMLLYDLRAPNPYVSDELASALLSSVISSTRNNLNLTLFDLPESKSYLSVNAYQALALAVKKVFELEIVDPSEFYEYVEPLTKEEVESLLHAFTMDIVERKDKPIILEEDNILISTLLYDVPNLVSLAELAMKNKKTLNVVTPSKPWVGVEDLEEAYRLYLTYNNVKQKLESMKVNIFPWSYLRVRKEKVYEVKSLQQY